MAHKVPTNQTKTKRKILIPLFLTLVLLLLTGILLIDYFDDFYHEEKAQEATLLAYTYAHMLEAALDAKALLMDQLHSTLEVAGNIISSYEGQFSDEVLTAFAEDLQVDALYIYNKNLEVEHSHDTLFDGWRVPDSHPVRDFYETELDHLVEPIRKDTEGPLYWLYSYQRFKDGRMLQVGILANKVAELSAPLEEQNIIESMAKDSPQTHIIFVNPENIIAASSIPDQIGSPIEDVSSFQAYREGNFRCPFREGGIDWHLKTEIPIKVNGADMGTLIILFDLSNTNKLFRRITITISLLLLVLFIFFTLSTLHIERKNKQIFSVAYYDDITGLPNLKYLKRIMKNHDYKSLALILIKSQHLEFINLIYGFHAGNTLLTKVGSSLNAIVYPGVHLRTYQFTDNQFIMTVENYKDLAELHMICDKILAVTETSTSFASLDLTIGIVEWQKGSFDIETLIKEASIALNASTGTNRIQLYTTEIEEQILRQDAIENDIKRIIAGEQGILHMEYQPIVHAKTGSIISFEALARMNSSVLGEVYPTEFIAIAEERHLIIPLGKVILNHVAQCIRRLTDLGYGSYSIGVNISVLQILDDLFITILQKVARRAGIRPSQLHIELTESVVSNNFALLNQQLKEINSLGIGIAIDDFGTGFSSLNRLEELAVDMLKMDKQFVDKLNNPTAKGISSDIISMGHHLGKQIIAEGVETEDQYRQLLDMGCDYMQGFLFSKPVVEDEIIKLLQTQSHDSLRNHPLE